MQLQQFNSKIISITQLRRDIDVLENTLAQNDEALVVKNQDLLFAALSPRRYEQVQRNEQKQDQRTIDEAIADINFLRQKYGQTKKKNAGSAYVIKMRDEARKRWTK